MKAVMYHYVRSIDPTLPFFRFLDIENFRKQLDYFQKEFGFVSYEEWQNFMQHGEMPSNKGKVILTFDDAMRCHYDYVFPELVERNLWAIFFVPSSPYSDNLILDVHRIHLLCGAFRGYDLLSIATSLIDEDIIPGEKIAEFRDGTYTRQQNSTGISEFKRLMNYFVDYQYRTYIISEVANQLGFDFKRDCFYVPLESLKVMKQNGMVIGSHSHSHPVMSRLSAIEQRREIEKSLSVLGTLVGDHITYCHPYGGFHSFNKDTVDALIQLGVTCAFNVESREISPEDYRDYKFALPRFDCNLFPFGQAS